MKSKINFKDYRTVEKSGYFDADWYVANYPIVEKLRMEPLRHYFLLGEKNNYNPSPKFTVKLYRELYPDISSSGASPLVHYLTIGQIEGRLANSADYDFFKKQASEWVSQFRISSTLKAELLVEPFQSLNFHLKTYLHAYPYLTNDHLFKLKQEWQQINDSGMFDTKWYLSYFPTGLDLEMDPLLHYLLFGEKFGYSPSAEFYTEFYLGNNPDIRAIMVSPLLHYVMAGKQEGRLGAPHKDSVFENFIGHWLRSYRIQNPMKLQVCHLTFLPTENEIGLLSQLIKDRNLKRLFSDYQLSKSSVFFDEAWYASYFSPVFKWSSEPLLHYLMRGESENKTPSALFLTEFYLEEYPDIKNSGLSPLSHYLTTGKSEGRLPLPNLSFIIKKYPDFFLRLLWKKYPVKECQPFIEEYPKKTIEKFLQENLTALKKALSQIGCESVLSRYLLYKESGLFDGKWYQEKYFKSLDREGVNPLLHFITIGENEGAQPSEQFHTRYYLKRYPDVKQSGIPPFLHYLLFGKNERRRCTDYQKIENQMELWIKELVGNYDNLRSEGTGPLVSIVMPTKNRIDILPRAIDSILAQTFTKWELLVIDDHSSDDTINKLTFLYQDSRIKIFGNEGYGVSAARNTGIKQAKGEFIAYLDSDNIWVETYLDYMLRAFSVTRYEWAYAVLKCYLDFSNEDTVRYEATDFNYETLKANNYIDINVFMHHKNLYERYGGFDEALRRFVDWDLVLRYCKEEEGGLNLFVGCHYDDSERKDRITHSEDIRIIQSIQNKLILEENKVKEKGGNENERAQEHN